ncbi:MAG: LysM peptidoglycan-binding domain-containing protein, partial [Alphaproteobacteria bacterium]
AEAPTAGAPAAGTATTAATGIVTPPPRAEVAPTPGFTGVVGAQQPPVAPGAAEVSGAAPAETAEMAMLSSVRPPSFDAVRINEFGDAVIAGRASPRAVVVILDGDREIGRVAADQRGDWVFVSSEPLEPGQHQLGLRAEVGGAAVLSDRVVVLIAPEPQRDIAGRETGGAAAQERPLALLVPRDEVGPTTVLQVPEAPPMVAETVPQTDLSAPSPFPELAQTPAELAPLASLSPVEGAAVDGAKPVSIDVVDYDEQGRLIVTGQSDPSAVVRLYINNQPVGTAVADPAGAFRVQPSSPVPPGVYRLRVDQIDRAGAVLARAETPFQRAEATETLPGFTRVVVQPGNSLWRIARRVFGHGIQYTVIYQANRRQIRNPDLIYPGQIFAVPAPPDSVPGGDPS